MEILKYIILGILQGVTEPLPVSSSGHIYILKAMLNTNIFNDFSLEIFLNFASFLAILFILRKDIISLIKGFILYLKSKGTKGMNEFKYCMMIILGTIPVGILGLLAKDILEDLLAKNIFLVGIGFFITGLSLLLVIDTKGTKNDYDITVKDALLIGLFQAVSIVPGISRGGMTLIGCLLNGLNSKSALKYSFMLYLPVSIATMITGIGDISLNTFDITTVLYYIVGMISAYLLTYITYKWLSKIVENGKLWRFSIYLFAIAMFTIMLFI